MRRCGECSEVVVRWHPVRAGERVFCEPRCKWRFHSRLWRVRHTGAQHNGAEKGELKICDSSSIGRRHGTRSSEVV